MKLGKYLLVLTALAANAATPAADSPRLGTYSTGFDALAPYANANTIMQRMMLGDVYRTSVAEARSQGINLKAFTVSPSEETWDIYVPSQYQKGEKYGVLVWIPQSPAAEVPSDWKNTLDKHKLIYVAPRQAGNDQPTLERRVPMALLGLNGIAHQYKIDPKRIYIAGSGGGAEVAGNIALGFPDVFQGAVMLGDGPDLGTRESAVPPEVLLEYARQNHYSFVAERDDAHARRIIGDSVASFQKYCILATRVINSPAAGDANLLDSALEYLATPPGKVTSNQCVANLAREKSAAIAEVRNAAENLPPEEAMAIWQEKYLEFGGLIDKEMRALKEKIEARQKQRTPAVSLSRD